MLDNNLNHQKKIGKKAKGCSNPQNANGRDLQVLPPMSRRLIRNVGGRGHPAFVATDGLGRN